MLMEAMHSPLSSRAKPRDPAVLAELSFRTKLQFDRAASTRFFPFPTTEILSRKHDQSDPQKVRSQQMSNLQPEGSQQHYIGDAKRTLQGQEQEHSNGQPSIRGRDGYRAAAASK